MCGDATGTEERFVAMEVSEDTWERTRCAGKGLDLSNMGGNQKKRIVDICITFEVDFQ